MYRMIEGRQLSFILAVLLFPFEIKTSKMSRTTDLATSNVPTFDSRRGPR